MSFSKLYPTTGLEWLSNKRVSTHSESQRTNETMAFSVMLEVKFTNQFNYTV